MSFINIPFSIIEKRWFTDEMAVRAWVFLAARGILSKSNSTITIKNKAFELEPGETLCTRSYLSKYLKINDSNAKGATDKLLRAKSIFKEIEVLEKGFRNKITRVKVEGIPVPNEAFLQVAMVDDISIMWRVKHLVQLYIYLMLSANKFDKITIAGGQILEIKRGELVISYTKIRQDLKISEYFLKKTMQYLEGLGLVEKSRCGNDGLFVIMKKYPPAPSKKEKIEERAVENTATEVPTSAATVNANTAVAAVQAMQPVQPENSPQKGLPSADWEGWIKNSATKAIVWYAQRRGWRNIDRINNMITDVGESGVDLNILPECLKHLWKTSGNNVVDSRDKAVFVDGAYILKYYNFYLTQKNQALQQSSATEYSSDSNQQQQSQPATVDLGSEEEKKRGQVVFDRMIAWIQSRGNNGVEYVKNWMSNRHCCVSGFDMKSETLYIDIFGDVKERWDVDKKYLMPVFKHFFGNNVRLVFNILEHSI